MRKSQTKMVVLAMVATVSMWGCGADPSGLDITEARIGMPTGPNAAMYFTVTGGGEPDRLLGASTEAASAVQMHETTTGDDGTMGMSAVDGLEVPAGDGLVLEPGGFHLMLLEARRMEVGEMVDVRLVWERAGEMIVTAEVVDPGNTMGHGS